MVYSRTSFLNLQSHFDRKEVKSAVNKEMWKAVFTGNQKKILSIASNFISLSIKFRGSEGEGNKAQQNEKINSKNTPAECKETYVLGSNGSE